MQIKGQPFPKGEGRCTYFVLEVFMIGHALLFFMAWVTAECWVKHLKEVFSEQA